MNKIKTRLVLLFLALLPSLTARASPSGTWSVTGSMSIPRVLHAATLLPDGSVLITGGITIGGNPTATVELYDPTTGMWHLTNSMTTARSRHTATLLQDGRVLVTGGRSAQGVSLHTAELYDPTTGTWTPTGSLTDARAHATATLLPDGRALVTGGLSDDRLDGIVNNSAEIYDPQTSLWIVADHMANARYGHQALLLPSCLPWHSAAAVRF
jgi:hypothetical protein